MVVYGVANAETRVRIAASAPEILLENIKRDLAMRDKCSECKLPFNIGDDFEVDATLGGSVKEDPIHIGSVIMKGEFILQQKFYHPKCRKRKTGENTDSMTRIPVGLPVGFSKDIQPTSKTQALNKPPVIRSLNDELNGK